ncbi:hypothetical protein HK098_001387 [Nowakowskiella sp. JEL0407]|nr:hypothetical protein HK098_001387 [Nowakowskiella sp. JEL0407]
MNIRQRILISFGLLARCYGLFWNLELSHLLANRPEITVPTTSFKQLKEGIFLYSKGLNPYDGGIFRQSPIVLKIYSILRIPQLSSLFMIIIDCLIAFTIYYIAIERVEHQKRAIQKWNAVSGSFEKDNIEEEPKKVDKSVPKEKPIDPFDAPALFFANPYGIATCIAKSTIGLNSLAVVLGLLFAIKGKSC